MWLEIVSLSVLSSLVMSSTFSFSSSAKNDNEVITCTDGEACTITCEYESLTPPSGPQCDFIPSSHTPVQYRCPSDAECNINLQGNGLMYGTTIYAQDSSSLTITATGNSAASYLTIYCPTDSVTAVKPCELTASGGDSLFDGVTLYKDTASGVSLNCDVSNHAACLGWADSFTIIKRDLQTMVCIIEFVAGSPITWNCNTPHPTAITANPSTAPTHPVIATSPIYQYLKDHNPVYIHLYSPGGGITKHESEGIAFQMPTNDADVSGYNTIDLIRWKRQAGLYPNPYNVYILSDTATSEWTSQMRFGKCFTLTGNKHPAAVELFRYEHPAWDDTFYTIEVRNDLVSAGWSKKTSPCYVFPPDYGSGEVLPRLHVAPVDAPRSMHFDFNTPNFGLNTFVCVILAVFVMGSCALTVAVLNLSNPGGKRKKIVV